MPDDAQRPRQERFAPGRYQCPQAPPGRKSARILPQKYRSLLCEARARPGAGERGGRRPQGRWRGRPASRQRQRYLPLPTRVAHRIPRRPPQAGADKACKADAATPLAKVCQQSVGIVPPAARDFFVAGLRQTIIRGGLELLYFSGAHFFLKPFVGGVGAILTLHHVRPPRPGRFQPNRLLEITPRFFARVVKYLRRSGLDLVSLDEMHRRLSERDFSRRFVCLTFDDGYRDTLQFAYPILKEAGVPFAVYVATSFPDRLGELWWLALEAVIARNDRIGLTIDGRNRTFDCATRCGEARALRRALLVAARAADGGGDARRDPQSRGLLQRGYRGVLQGTVHELGGAGAACGRSARHHRRAHGQSSDAGEAAGKNRALGNGFEPLGDRSGACGAARAFVVSGRRPHLRRTARICASPPNSASRPR